MSFFCYLNNIKPVVIRQSRQAQEASFQETAATLFQTDSTFPQVSQYSNGQIRNLYVFPSMLSPYLISFYFFLQVL